MTMADSYSNKTVIREFVFAHERNRRNEGRRTYVLVVVLKSVSLTNIVKLEEIICDIPVVLWKKSYVIFLFSSSQFLLFYAARSSPPPPLQLSTAAPAHFRLSNLHFLGMYHSHPSGNSCSIPWAISKFGENRTCTLHEQIDQWKVRPDEEVTKEDVLTIKSQDLEVSLEDRTFFDGGSNDTNSVFSGPIPVL
ncbi:hypothetical protein OROGR_007070 [Orobanche gracilis]